MQAIIMAGGKGTRLAAFTKDVVPKPMVNILGKPLLEWQINVLKRYNIIDICFVIGYLGYIIKDYFRDGKDFGINASYIEETEPLGTAGSLFYLNKQLLSDDVLLIFGDIFFDIDIDKMIRFHAEKKSKATLFVHPNSHPFDSDLIKLDSDSRIIGLDSKHNTRNYYYDNCVNAGLCIINKDVIEKVRKPVKTDLEKDIYTQLVQENLPIYGYRSPEYVKDIGTIERIAETIKDIENGFIYSKNLSNKQKCIFLDRDGTVNKYKGLIVDIDSFELEDKVPEAIKKINHTDWLCIVVTNQPAVARGLCEVEDVQEIHKKMAVLLGGEGAFLDDVLFCPHHPDKGYPEENRKYKIKCGCRKPGIDMITECERRFNIDLTKSWIVGDTTIDIKTGENARMHTALVLTGEAGRDGKYSVKPEIVGENLLQVIEKIIEEDYNEVSTND